MHILKKIGTLQTHVTPQVSKTTYGAGTAFELSSSMGGGDMSAEKHVNVSSCIHGKIIS